MLPMMALVGLLAQGAIADESKIDGKQRDVGGVGLIWALNATVLN